MFHGTPFGATGMSLGRGGVLHRNNGIWVAGYVVRDPSPRPSSWRAKRSLEEELARQGGVGISGVDTRMLTRYIRRRGAMRAGVFSGEALADEEAMRIQVLDLAAHLRLAACRQHAELILSSVMAGPCRCRSATGAGAGGLVFGLARLIMWLVSWSGGWRGWPRLGRAGGRSP